MARKWPLAVVAIAVALVGTGLAAGAELPLLRSATAVRWHVVIRIDVSDFQPVEFRVATSRAADRTGALLATNVRLQERITLPLDATGIVRWRSPKALRPGTWFVQVRVVDAGGVTECPVTLRQCLQRWSNVRRVVIR